MKKSITYREITLDLDNQGHVIGVEVPEIEKLEIGMIRIFLSWLGFPGTSYDAETSTAYIRMRRGKIDHSVVAKKKVVLDLDKKGRVIGLEVVNLKPGKSR